MATEVRPKGITRPLQGQQALGGTQATRQGDIERAVQIFLSAENWSMTLEILNRMQLYLLTDEALALLTEFIQQAQGSNLPGTENIVAYLTAHRELVEHARALGIPAAWEEFQRFYIQPMQDTDAEMPQDSETQRIIDALRRFLSTETWSETRQLIEREDAYLLSDIADQFLSSLIYVASQSDDPAAADGLRYLEMHRTLLREVRRLGLETAWADFERARQQGKDERMLPDHNRATDDEMHAVTMALRALLTTSTWEETHQVLVREQRVLLSPACAQLFDDLVQATEQEHEPHTARHLVYLKMHQRLLQRARQEGIDAAWAAFTDAMNISYTPLPESEDHYIAEPPSPFDLALQRTRDAVQDFLGASSWKAAKNVLQERQDELLTDLAIALITAQADQLQAHGTERDLYATRLLNLQAQLLRRAREVGLENAWKEFEAERE